MGRSSLAPDDTSDSAAIAASFDYPESFADIFDRHYVAVHRYLARRAPRAQADDLSSTTFVVAFERRGSFRPQSTSARPWLLGIATNLLHERARVERREHGTLVLLETERSLTGEGAEVEAGESVETDRLARALATLDSAQRDVLLLHAWEELSYEEIAQALEIPLGTVRSRLARVREHTSERGLSSLDLNQTRPMPGAQMTDELDLLRHNRSEPAPPSEEARTAARHELERAMHRDPRTLTDSARRKRAGARRRLLLSVALAIALAVLAIAVGASLRSSSTTEPALAAGPVLQRLARIASTQPWAVPGRGQYLYTTSHSLTEADTALAGGVYCRLVFEQYRQNWIAANGEGLFRESDGPAHYHSRGEAAACRKTAPAQPANVSETWAAPGCLSIDPIPLGRLSNDPAKLRAHLLTGKVEGGPPGPSEAFTQVGDLLRETDAPPALRAALYRAAAGLPGVKSLGRVTDTLGRRGVGLAFDSHGVRHELIFSAKTSALLAEQDMLVSSVHGLHAARGEALEWSAYSAGQIVNRLPASPPFALTPPCIRGGGTGLSVPGHPEDSVIVGSSPRPQPGLGSR